MPIPEQALDGLAEDNESGGTDHGAGGLLLLVGNRANGGIRSEFPGLTRLDPDDNLVVTTDFRSVYATLLEDWLVSRPRGCCPKCPAAATCRCCAPPEHRPRPTLCA